jgi:hypothetical protein
MNTVSTLNVNDYLDLYLFAGKVGDTLWQHEIIEKLQNLSNKNPSTEPLQDIEVLWINYKSVNEKILALYQQMRNQSTNDELQEKIWDLKQQRILLGRQIGLTKGSPTKN